MYTEYQPSRLLAPYIDNYWEFKGTPEYGMRIHILPDGCTDFIFTLGEAVSKVKEETLVMQPYRSYFVGPMTKYSELVTYAEFVHQFGVRFLPCGLSGFTKLPLHEFANTESVRMKCRRFLTVPLSRGYVSRMMSGDGFRSLKNISWRILHITISLLIPKLPQR